MMLFAFAVGVFIARRKANFEGVDPDDMSVLCVFALLAGILGAKVFHVTHQIAGYARSPLETSMIQGGGLSLYGGAIAGFIVWVIVCRRRGVPVLKSMDLGAVGFALGLVFGRIGCFLNGCCYGHRVADDFIFRVYFPKITDTSGNIDGSIVFLHHLKEGWVNLTDTTALPVHPTQLYSALGAFVLFLILSNVYEYKRRDGEVALLLALLYAPMRFYWEMLRDDSAPVMFGLTVSQLVGIPVFLLALWLLVDGRRRLRNA
ncbi:MAG: prolipoprotein diacylglyceryl transferase [Candidatus Brocadiales bacterium]|nr:prolipoprotein diacylglyceryl transferase [Candidatus Bathyanammoxibius sp.]